VYDEETPDYRTPEQRAEVERFEAGEDIGEGAEPVELLVKKPLHKVVPIRMNDDQWRTLTREAEELGLRPTTLLRMWVLERLRDAERARRGPRAVAEAGPSAARRPGR